MCLRCGAATYYVTTNGLAGNSGAINSPLSLAKALSSTSPAVAGDLIYVRGGTYTNANSFTSQLPGANGNPITVMAYPGERAIIDGNYNGTGGSANTLVILGSFTDFVGLEIINSYTNRGSVSGRPDGVDNGGNSGPSNGSRIINCFVHDCGDGIGTWVSCTNCETYGNIINNNGYQNIPPDRGHGHGLYIQNSVVTGLQKHRENIILNTFDVGAQIYEQGGGDVANVLMQGNVVANSGAPNDTTLRTVNYVEYSTTKFVHAVTNLSLFSYNIPGADTNGGIPANLQVGNFGGAENGDVVLSNSYFANGLVSVQLFTNVLFGGNTNLTSDGSTKAWFTHPGVGTNTWVWDGNNIRNPGNLFDFNGFAQTFATWQAVSVFFDANSTFTTAAPATNDVFIRANAFQPNRANIICYNWISTNTIPVNLTNFMAVGTQYQIKNAFDYGGNPVLSGTYDGGIITLPMTNLNVAAPFGVPAAPSTSPKFAVFVVVPVVGATNIAASCNQADVQTAIALSNPGDTVIVPAGTCDWTVSVLLTNQINLIFQGTVISDSIINTGDGANSSCLQVAVPLTPYIETRVSGATFVTGSRVTKLFDSGNIHLSGGSQLVRIDHCNFNAKLNIGIGGGDVFGVIDHNVFDAQGAFTQPMKLSHPSYGGAANGYGAWALPSWTNSYHEDASAIYIEDNVGTNNSGAPGLGIDGFGGARWVDRHNIWDRIIDGGHGTETTAQFAGCRLKDVYNSLFIEHGDSEPGHYRSGSGVLVSNTIVSCPNFFQVRNYRLAFGGFWNYANATNSWDSNNPTIFASGLASSGGTLTMTDLTQNWTPNQWVGFTIRNVPTGQGSVINASTANTVTYAPPTEGNNMAFSAGQAYEFRQVYTVLDEVGRGQGTLRNNTVPAWPNEALDPVYQWANTLNGSSPLMDNGGYYTSVVGQEIVNGTNTNWVPYIYPHPLVSGTNGPPPPPTPPSQIARVTLLRVGNTKTGP